MVDLAKTIEELHSYVRTTVQVFLQWFGIFLAANFVAVGWFAQKLTEDEPKHRTTIYAVFSLFVTLCGLALPVCISTRTWLRTVTGTIEVMYSASPESDLLLEHFRAQKDLPLGLYTRLVSIVAAVIVVLILFWAALLIRYVIYS